MRTPPWLLIAAGLCAMQGTGSFAANLTESASADTHDEMQDREKEVVNGSKATLDNSTFVQKAMQTNLAEVGLANLALSKAQSDSVKKYAEEMKSDHTGSQAELSKIAEGAGMTYPKTLDPEHQQLEDHLATISGSEFDRQYMDAMVSGHETVVAMYSAKARASDGDLSAYAQKRVPVLETHLTHAREVDKGLQSSPKSLP